MSNILRNERKEWTHLFCESQNAAHICTTRKNHFPYFICHWKVGCCCCYLTRKNENTWENNRDDNPADSWFRWIRCSFFSPFPCTVKVAEHCQQQLKLEGLSCQWQSREEKRESLSLCACVYAVLAPDALAQSSMTQLLTTPHFAGINGGPAGGRQTASNERRTLQSSQTRKRRVFASSLNLLLCCLKLSFMLIFFHRHEPLPHKLRIIKRIAEFECVMHEMLNSASFLFCTLTYVWAELPGSSLISDRRDGTC